MQQWLTTACRADIVRRSLRIAAVVGTLLVLINYGDRMLAGAIADGDWLKIGLTYCVPYSVSTFASVSAVLSQRN